MQTLLAVGDMFSMRGDIPSCVEKDRWYRVVEFSIIPCVDFSERLSYIGHSYRTSFIDSFKQNVTDRSKASIEPEPDEYYSYFKVLDLEGSKNLSFVISERQMAKIEMEIRPAKEYIPFRIGDIINFETGKFSLIEMPASPHQIGRPLRIVAIKSVREIMCFDDEDSYPQHKSCDNWRAVLVTEGDSYLSCLVDFEMSFWVPIAMVVRDSLKLFISSYEQKNTRSRFAKIASEL